MVKGEEAAYGEFFESYFQRLFGYLLVVTNGKEELARELLQQTMIKVARHARVFTDEQAFWRWLTGLATTSAFDESRKARRYLSFLDRFWQARAPAQVPEPARNDSFDMAFAQELA